MGCGIILSSTSNLMPTYHNSKRVRLVRAKKGLKWKSHFGTLLRRRENGHPSKRKSNAPSCQATNRQREQGSIPCFYRTRQLSEKTKTSSIYLLFLRKIGANPFGFINEKDNESIKNDILRSPIWAGFFSSRYREAGIRNPRRIVFPWQWHARIPHPGHMLHVWKTRCWIEHSLI